MKKIVKIKESELVSLIEKIITETVKKKKLNENEMQLRKINLKEAKNLFDNDYYIYIKTDNKPADTSVNLFLLNRKNFDGSMNIYTGNMTPEEYGLINILKWVKERSGYVELYTLDSKEPLLYPLV